MFSVVGFAALLETNPSQSTRKRWSFQWIMVIFFLTILIGFRYEVGGDWGNYIRNLEGISGTPLSIVINSGDPGYQLASWIAVKLGWGIFGVNLICGLIFSVGLIAFCRDQPRPWLALLAAVPYMIIVVAMGYSRQAVAIGLAMIALVSLSRKSTLSFVIWITLAATFHRSAIILIPIAILSTTDKRFWTAIWVSVSFFILTYLFIADVFDVLYKNYIETEYSSQGAFIRLLMSAVPAFIFLIWRDRFNMSISNKKLWTSISILALLMFGLLFVTPSSTAIDRIGLYIIPLQMFVFSRIPDAVSDNPQISRFMSFGIAGYYASVQFVWLFFAVHASWWLPYRSFLFM